jgi:hypothetical protein
MEGQAKIENQWKKVLNKLEPIWLHLRKEMAKEKELCISTQFSNASDAIYFHNVLQKITLKIF